VIRRGLQPNLPISAHPARSFIGAFRAVIISRAV